LQVQSTGQRWHRITHRVLIDQQHRCMRRTAPEEWNLAINYHEHDVTSAEFVRTYRSVDFSGTALLKKLEAEQRQGEYAAMKILPAIGSASPQSEIWLQYFPDLYGYRGWNEKNGRLLVEPLGISHVLGSLEITGAA